MLNWTYHVHHVPPKKSNTGATTPMNENLSHQNCCPAEVLNHLHDFTKKSYQTSKNLSIVPKLENEPGILNHPTKTRQFVHGFDLES